MIKRLDLQNFRNYSKKSLEFGDGTTLIAGPNAAGKTNVLEAIHILATGKSFRAENEQEVIGQSSLVTRIVGVIGDEIKVVSNETKEKKREVGNRKPEPEVRSEKLDQTELEIDWDGRERFTKTYKVNGVGKRMVDFVGNFRAVLFSPQDIEIVADSPATRRRYLNSVLSLVHRDYRVAGHVYERALRQRNKLLWKARELGINRNLVEFDYWDKLLIENGRIIHERRKEYLSFLSNLGDLSLDYDHSVISKERLEKYAREEIAAAATLVGPQRDDFTVKIQDKIKDKRFKTKDKITEVEDEIKEAEREVRNWRDVKSFGSRGEQRLAVFEIKLGELEFVRRVTGEDPVLLLDDIFSELDHSNRQHILKVIPRQQTIITTTDLHLAQKEHVRGFDLINLPEAGAE